ncbi:MAG: monovalent cation/H(+) antiporter subunit G [Candidatus Omnitrophota bacterium]
MIELGKIFLILGLIFDLIGTISLMRMPDIYSQLQSAAKSVTLGTCLILFGVFLSRGMSSAGFKTLLVLGFLILISPVSVHALARGIHKSRNINLKNYVCDQYHDDQLRKKDNISN